MAGPCNLVSEAGVSDWRRQGIDAGNKLEHGNINVAILSKTFPFDCVRQRKSRTQGFCGETVAMCVRK